MSETNLVPVTQAFDLPNVDSYPRYQYLSKHCGIFHIGIGGFHRSHMANYIDQYLQNHNEDWSIHACGILESDKEIIRAISEQNNLYTLVERSGNEDKVKIIGSLGGLSFVGPQQSEKKAFIIDRMASNQIKIISMTITEKGYYYDENKDLDLENENVVYDLTPGNLPVTAIGMLVHSFRVRMQDNAKPVTVLSCDNLPGNGNITKKIVLQFANEFNQDVARWIQRNVSFPNSMVDRITPNVTSETKELVAQISGIEDNYPVVSEDYIQWIIEDNFIAGRPQLEDVGVQFVDDVVPYEKMKVRLLNGSHSALSYLSYLIGFEDVDKAMADKNIRSFVEQYMEEVTPTIPNVPGIDLEQYKSTLIRRFSNAAISDKVLRLASDGTTKIANAIVPVLEINLSAKRETKTAALALAAWFRFLYMSTQDKSYEVNDPGAGALLDFIGDDALDVDSIFDIKKVFGNELSSKRDLQTQVRKYYKKFVDMDASKALTEFLEDKQ